MTEGIERKPIPSWDGYEASADGRIWRVVRKWNYLPGEMTQQQNAKTGYMSTSLTRDGKSIPVLVHRLVALAFHGDHNISLDVRHRNGIRTDNAKDNLEWGTPKDNADDRDRHGATARGERIASSKLTSADVLRIVKELDAGRTYAELACKHNVTRECIGAIANGINWSHLTGIRKTPTSAA